MATAKQTARKELAENLKKEMVVAKQNLRSNLFAFKRLAEQQAVLKRKVKEIYDLLKALEAL